MGYSNDGDQAIVWRFETPLRSDYLSQGLYGAFIHGVVRCPVSLDVAVFPEYGPGGRLEFLPNVHVPGPGDPGAVIIGPLALFVPNRTRNAGESGSDMVFKVTTGTSVRVPVTARTVAIGYSYEYRPQGEWWGDFEALDAQNAANYPGVIICGVRAVTQGGLVVVEAADPSVCDKSDTLFRLRGEEPRGHLSPLSPRDLAWEAAVGGRAGLDSTFVIRDFHNALTEFTTRILRPPGEVAALNIATSIRLNDPTVFVPSDAALTVGHKYAIGYAAFNHGPGAETLPLRVVARSAGDSAPQWSPDWNVIAVVTWGGDAMGSRVGHFRIQGGYSFIQSDLPVNVYNQDDDFLGATTPGYWYRHGTREFCLAVSRVGADGVNRVYQEKWFHALPFEKRVRHRDGAGAWAAWETDPPRRETLANGSWRMFTASGGYFAWDQPTGMLSYSGPVPNSAILPSGQTLADLGLLPTGEQGRIHYLMFTIAAGGVNFNLSGGTGVGVRNIWARDASGGLRHYRTVGRGDFGYTAGDELAVMTDVWAAIDQLAGGLQPPIGIPTLAGLPAAGSQIGAHFLVQDMGAAYNNSAGAAWWGVPSGGGAPEWQFLVYKNFAPDGVTASLTSDLQIQVHPTLVARIGTVEATANAALARSGGTMTGEITLPASPADIANNTAAARQNQLLTQLSDNDESNTNLSTSANQSWSGLMQAVRNVLRYLLARVRNPASGTAQNPLMDGVVGVGNGAEFARWNHRHPTDTGRAAATHDHTGVAQGGFLGVGSVETTQIADGSIIGSHISDNVLALRHLARTGTAGQLLRSGGHTADASWVNAPVSYPGDGTARVGNISSERILGRAAANSGAVEQLTAAAARTLLNVENGAQVNAADGLARIGSLTANRIVGRGDNSGAAQQLTAAAARALLNVENGAQVNATLDHTHSFCSFSFHALTGVWFETVPPDSTYGSITVELRTASREATRLHSIGSPQ